MNWNSMLSIISNSIVIPSRKFWSGFVMIVVILFMVIGWIAVLSVASENKMFGWIKLPKNWLYAYNCEAGILPCMIYILPPKQKSKNSQKQSKGSTDNPRNDPNVLFQINQKHGMVSIQHWSSRGWTRRKFAHRFTSGLQKNPSISRKLSKMHRSFAYHWLCSSLDF